MKTVVFVSLALMMAGCAAPTEDAESGEDLPPGDDAGTCLAGEECGDDTPGDHDGPAEGTCLAGDEECGNDTPGDLDGPAGGTCLAGEECGNDTPGDDADPFATCLTGEDCGSDTPGDGAAPLP